MIRDLLARPVAFHPAIARAVGSVPAGVMLCQAIYWSDRIPQPRPAGCPGPDWFYHSIEEWERETALSRNEQKTARKRLAALGVLKDKRVGIPAKLYYQVNIQNIEKILKNPQITVSRQTRVPRGGKHAGCFTANKTAAPRKTLCRTEITSQITPPPPRPDQNQDQDGGGEMTYDQFQHQNQDQSRLEEEEEYVRLVLQNSIIRRDRVQFERSLRDRLKEQGGLSDLDREQVEGWRAGQQIDLSNCSNQTAALAAVAVGDQNEMGGYIDY
jgi:hypothetical protein